MWDWTAVWKEGIGRVGRTQGTGSEDLEDTAARRSQRRRTQGTQGCGLVRTEEAGLEDQR